MFVFVWAVHFEIEADPAAVGAASPDGFASTIESQLNDRGTFDVALIAALPAGLVTAVSLGQP